MRLADHVAFASYLEQKLAVSLFVDVADVCDQSDDVSPFEIMGRRMMEYRFERASARPCDR